jgi:N-acyl-D-amino-acid deacylase
MLLCKHRPPVQQLLVPTCDTIIRDVEVLDGTGGPSRHAHVAIHRDRIQAVGELNGYSALHTVKADSKALAPGFIDAHTHDDICVIERPEMMPKLSQGITTVVTGNCGISAAPVRLSGSVPDPMNLLGNASSFRYPTFTSYVDALNAAHPAVNVATLVGHTALRNNYMDRLDRSATSNEIDAMRKQLREALDHGAIGLSTGLAYLSAYSADTSEVAALAQLLSEARGIYTTHLRSESQAILEAIGEALNIGHRAQVPVIISHLKCYGIDNWGRAAEVLQTLEAAPNYESLGWDCYPYSASSSTLDLRQVDERVSIVITWSEPHPQAAGQTLEEIAGGWSVSQMEAAKRLQPAGAIYHAMSEEDVRMILRHPATMIGSDGLPNDPRPHPRLWGTFPRFLGHYSREERLFPLGEAIHKMTGLPAERFGLKDRGFIREGYFADVVLFNPETIRDLASFDDPVRAAVGIDAVWVNGVLSYDNQATTGARAGRFLARQRHRESISTG